MNLKKLVTRDYIVVPQHKRTITVNYTDKKSKRYFIEMPKMIFIKRDSSTTVAAFALNENDEFCHLPFLNINLWGGVCITNFNPVTPIVESWSKAFFATPFQLCYDVYADSLNIYFDKYRKEKFTKKEVIADCVFPEKSEKKAPNELFGSGYKRPYDDENSLEAASIIWQNRYINKMAQNIDDFYSNFKNIKLIKFRQSYFPCELKK